MQEFDSRIQKEKRKKTEYLVFRNDHCHYVATKKYILYIYVYKKKIGTKKNIISAKER